MTAETKILKESAKRFLAGLPQIKYCPNKNTFCGGVKKPWEDTYCGDCGTRLEQKPVDIKINIEYDNLDDENGKPKKIDITLKQFFILLKEYEKEIFIEEL